MPMPCLPAAPASPPAGRVFAKINWRVPLMDPLTGEEDFAERSTMQRFVQTVRGRGHLTGAGGARRACKVE